MVNFFSQLRKRIWGGPVQPAVPLPPLEPEPEEMVVPEMTAPALQSALASATPPLVLDIREAWEWRQVRLPVACHIPMNDVPDHLAELPHNSEIVVICAHGSRSYGVAGYLVEQGYQASSLAGGITQWVQQGGEVQQS